MSFNNRHSCGSPDKTIINRIMQRFRPIAPRPVTEGSHVASPLPAELVSTGRKKRKYVRVKNNNMTRFSKADEGKGAFLSPSSGGVSGSEEKRSFTVWNFTPEQPPSYPYRPSKNESDLAVGAPSRKIVESWVVVDSMTETWHDVAELGNSDTEKMRNLEMDTCPGLISDGDNRVQWINHAYQEMVERDEKEEAVVVKMVLREKIPEGCQVFSCSVRVMYNKYSQTMPCDVWRMDYGGFAWRLDATAALKLGR